MLEDNILTLRFCLKSILYSVIKVFLYFPAHKISQ